MEVSSSRVPLGERTLLHSIIQDVTARKEAERSLIKARAHYQSLLETASDGIHVIDQQGKLVEASTSFYRMLGYPTGAPELCYVCDWDAQWNLEELKERMLELMAIPAVFETRHRCRDGSAIDVEINARSIVIEGVPCLYASSRDITERKKAEEVREKLQKQLAETQKIETIGELAGGIAHDFNNMIGIICGHAELAMGQLDPEDSLSSNLEEIRNAARRSADLTRQLLAFARRQVILPRPVDLNVVISGLMNPLGRLLGERIRLDWRPGGNLWMVKSDATQIDQILRSLCANARDAIAGMGSVTIETENTTLDEVFCQRHGGIAPGEFVRLTVKDNGCGMDSAMLSHIFEPFYSTKGLGHGTGLGLATVYGAVMQNNGCVTVDSGLNRGTTFSIFLPRMAGSTEIQELEKHHDSTAHGSEKILLVEDEPSLLKLTALLLERQGYVVLPASTPAQALRWVQEWGEHIQLLITDVVMPEMNGKDLAHEILTHYPGMKCLFMSGYTADIIADHGVLTGELAFIQKPFSMSAMAAKVEECLGKAARSKDSIT